MTKNTRVTHALYLNAITVLELESLKLISFYNQIADTKMQFVN